MTYENAAPRPRTATREHTWVKHVITPVSALPGPDGEPVLFVDPQQQALAEEDAAYGCQVCSEPMAGNFNTECKGPDEY